MPESDSPPNRRQRRQALLLALLCSLAFLRESVLPTRALVPYPPELFDVVRAEAVADGSFDPGDAYRGLVAGGDKYLQSLCWDRVMQDRLREGDLPLWTRDITAGAPFVPQMAQVYEPINLLLLLLPSDGWYGIWLLVHLVPFGFLAYLFLRRIGCGHPAALLGLVSAVLGLWTQSKIHHNVILTAALSLWPMLSAVWDLAHAPPDPAKRRRTIGWLGLWSGLSWLSGFAVVSLQVTYLAGAFAAFLAIRRPRDERWRFLLAVGTGLSLGAVLSLAQMIPVLQAAAASSRHGGWDPTFLAAHGLDWDHALSMAWPDLLSWPATAFHPDAADPFGGTARPPWSQLVLLHEPLDPRTHAPFQSWVETSFAIGLAPTCCAAAALFDRRRAPMAWFFAALAGLAFAFATADEPWLSLARFVPGIASADLRRLLFSVAMPLVVLASLGADSVLAAGRRTLVTAGLLIVGAASIAALLWLHRHAEPASFVRATAELMAADAHHPKVAAVGGDADLIERWIRGAMVPGEAEHNLARLQSTFLRALLVAVMAASVLWVLRPRWRGPALTLLTASELVLAGLGPMQTVPRERVHTPPKVLAPTFAAEAPSGVRPRLGRLAGPTETRITSWYPGNLPGFHGLEDATGYNPLPAARFEQFFEAIEPDRPGKASVSFKGAGVGAFHDPASLRHPLCDLFDIRFILTREPLPDDLLVLDRTPPGTGDFHLYERLTVLPRATFVREVDIVPEERERLALLARTDRDVAHRVVLEDENAPRPRPLVGATADVRIVEHRDERVVVRVRCDADGYLRLHDPYDPGWRATVDGEEVEVLPADHYLRAVYLEPGRHEVVFTYDAPRVRWPRWASLFALVLIAGLCLRLPGRTR